MKKIFDENLHKKFIEVIKERRSVRIFDGTKIPKEDILSIIEAGTWAPTGCNNQELRFLILEKEKEIEGIAKFKPFVKNASHVILVFCDMSLPMSKKMYIEYKNERHLPRIDTGLALMNMTLYARSKNIDSCIFNLSEHHFKKDQISGIYKKIIYKLKRRLGFYKLMENNFDFYLRKELKIPDNLKIMCGLVLGFSKIYPDINKEVHGQNKVMRQVVNNYIIPKK
jgi:predicted oxidoreductase (fatty acid repression mutant protein)